MSCQRSIDLRLAIFPFRIGLKRSPILVCLLTAGVLKDVHEECARVQVDSRLVIAFCCKVAVIFLALYAAKFSIFCSHDCLSAENGD
jgi:hypothetical protein